MRKDRASRAEQSGSTEELMCDGGSSLFALVRSQRTRSAL
jgi:hypothetical protein